MPAANRLVEGEPPPAWTKRPNAKDDLRARARELRPRGCTYDRIQLELGCSKSSISLWVRDLPKPERARTSEEASAIARRGWEVTMRLRDEERQRAKEAAEQAVGDLSPRELFLLGVGLYWAEGGTDKPYDRRENVCFVNSDPGMIRVFLAWLDLLGVERERVRFKNTGESYRGCLVIKVRRSADLYRRIEGSWYGIVLGATQPIGRMSD